ncbi:MAG: HD domain-containing protein [Christensenellales bacterium]|jgi:molybdenum cofactor cytidylyltransferase
MKLPDRQECDRIFWECSTPKKVVRHCVAVAEYARSIAKKLHAAGFAIDEAAVFFAGLLHDCKRAEPNHATAAADYLASKGYAELGKLVAAHHDLPEPVSLDEAAILYYADKRMREDQKVTLAERFAGSQEKCRTEEAKAAWRKRQDAALAVEKLIEAALGTRDF